MSASDNWRQMTTVSVVVPVYNSKATLAELMDRLQMVLSSLVHAFEVILVNDGSSDRSWQVIGSLVARYPFVHGINLMRNYGQHCALLAGIRQAQYEIIVTLDDDLQHPPEEIPKLLAKLSAGYDIVYGKPAQRKHRTWRNIASKALKQALVVMGAEMAGHSSAFRAFRSILRRGFENCTGPQLPIDVLLSWSTDQVTHIPVKHDPRHVGKSGYTLSKLMSLAYTMLIGYSTLPLRLVSGVGLTTAGVGLVAFLYVMIRRLFQATDVSGFPLVASGIALLAGLQLLAIGVIGEYVARLHFRTMGKPPYVIREEIGNDVLTMENPLYTIRQKVRNDVL